MGWGAANNERIECDNLFMIMPHNLFTAEYAETAELIFFSGYSLRLCASAVRFYLQMLFSVISAYSVVSSA
jgi:hypothetical protein